MIASFIRSSGHYVPPKVLKNAHLEKLMDTSDEWIQQRTGIKERRWAEPDTATSDLALEAAKRAIAKSDIEWEDIDCIILGTATPDMEMPGTSVALQHKLGPSKIPCFDLRQACSAFIYSLQIADAFIKVGQYRNILLVGAEIHSKALLKTPEGRDVGVLFGDGAGAMIISARELHDPRTQGHIMATEAYAQGEFAQALCAMAPGTQFNCSERITPAMLEKKLHYPKMDGKIVFTHAVKRMSEVLRSLLTQAQIAINDVDLFLFHQANLRINNKVAELLKIDPGKCFNTIERFGNTTGATIPLGLDVAVEEGRLKRGMLVASAAFGGGFTWGAALYRY